MSSAGLSEAKEAEGATAGQTRETSSAEGDSASSPRPLSPSSPDEKLAMGLCGQCRARLLSPLDDVRYLISCTNWY